MTSFLLALPKNSSGLNVALQRPPVAFRLRLLPQLFISSPLQHPPSPSLFFANFCKLCVNSIFPPQRLPQRIIDEYSRAKPRVSPLSGIPPLVRSPSPDADDRRDGFFRLWSQIHPGTAILLSSASFSFNCTPVRMIEGSLPPPGVSFQLSSEAFNGVQWRFPFFGPEKTSFSSVQAHVLLSGRQSNPIFPPRS